MAKREQEPIRSEMTLMEVIVTMAEGNPGGATVAAELFKADPKDGYMTLLHADDMNLRGPLLWVAFKDACGGDLKQLAERIKKRDPELVKQVNAQCPPEFYHQAVEHGASYRR